MENKSLNDTALNQRQSRSEATQDALMHAAILLIAENGLENISILSIIEAAGQKNESALQYHFKNRDGLINAIHQRHSRKVDQHRQLIFAAFNKTKKPQLIDVATLMVGPAFELAKLDPDYRLYVKAFGREVAFSEIPALQFLNQSIKTNSNVSQFIRQSLSDLSKDAIKARLDSAVRFSSMSMSLHARSKNAFKGKNAELFYSRLKDSLVGILGAKESAATKAWGS